MVGPPRDEYLEDRESRFDGSEISLATIKGLTLKRKVADDYVYYGLFDDKNRLVGYLSLELLDNGMYRVALSQLANDYKGQGYGTFLYDYAVMNDERTLLSDLTQTPSSKKLWQRFREQGRFNVDVYDTESKQVVEVPPEEVYGNENLVWIATTKGKTINECLTILNERYKGERYIVWYGPATIGENYYNY